MILYILCLPTFRKIVVHISTTEDEGSKFLSHDYKFITVYMVSYPNLQFSS
jgi:hypothetical protein